MPLSCSSRAAPPIVGSCQCHGCALHAAGVPSACSISSHNHPSGCSCIIYGSISNCWCHCTSPPRKIIRASAYLSAFAWQLLCSYWALTCSWRWWPLGPHWMEALTGAWHSPGQQCAVGQQWADFHFPPFWVACGLVDLGSLL